MSPVKAVERMQGPCLFGQKAAEEILERLEGYLNDGGIKRVAVWGRGGVGKTTLVRNLEQVVRDLFSYGILEYCHLG